MSTTETANVSPSPRMLSRWLWPNVIPRSSLTVVDGDPGIGKSLITLDLAARVTLGSPWPDGSAGGDPGTALLYSGEDHLASTILPRLLAAGADPRRLCGLGITKNSNGLPLLPRDSERIEADLHQYRPDLVVFDPLAMFLPDMGNVRRAMTELVQLAASSGAAFVLVRHLMKESRSRALHRGLGSVGIIGAARSGYLVAPDPSDRSRSVLTPTKSNLGPAPAALAFRVGVAKGHAVIEWLGPSTTTTEEAARGGVWSDRPGALTAADLLVELLGPGELPVAEVMQRAKSASISERTLLRAKAMLRVKSRLVWNGPERAWVWSLGMKTEGEAG